MSDWKPALVQIVDQCHSCGRKMSAGAQIMMRPSSLGYGQERICLTCHAQPKLQMTELAVAQ